MENEVFKISMCLMIFTAQLNMKIYANMFGCGRKEIGKCEANQQRSQKTNR